MGSPAEVLAAAREHPAGRWIVSAYGAGGMANGAPVDRIRPDVRHPDGRDVVEGHGRKVALGMVRSTLLESAT